MFLLKLHHLHSISLNIHCFSRDGITFLFGSVYIKKKLQAQYLRTLKFTKRVYFTATRVRLFVS